MDLLKKCESAFFFFPPPAVGPHFKKRVESLDMEQQFDIRALILE